MYFTTAQLCQLTGLPLGTLHRLRSMGSVLAAKPGGSGRGHSNLWSPEQVLALAVARGLRACGVVSKNAEGVLQYLWGQTASTLEAHFQAGRTYLGLTITPQGTRCRAELVRRDEILDDETMDQFKAAALRSGVRPSALDVEAIWRFILLQAQAGAAAGEHGSQATPAEDVCVSDTSRKPLPR